MLIPGSPLDDPELPYLFRLFWLALAVFLWYRILVLPHRIEVNGVGRVTFVSVLRRVLTGLEARSSGVDLRGC